MQCVSLFLVFVSLIFIPGLVRALTDLYIETSTRISICGNGIIEGGEDCEGVDLDGKTCESLGFGPGVLSCDIACSFDTYDCGPAPTLTPTPIPTLIPTPTPTPTLIPTSTPTPVPTTVVSASAVTSAPVATTILSPTAVPLPTATPTPSLPQVISFFDVNGDGKIHLSELYPAVKKWVDEWRKFLAGGTDYQKNMGCDINRDERCDLIDFSVLMSYVGI
jgi:hypothetical protein